MSASIIILSSDDEDDAFFPSSQATPPPDSQVPPSEPDFIELSDDDDDSQSSYDPFEVEDTRPDFSSTSYSSTSCIEILDDDSSDEDATRYPSSSSSLPPSEPDAFVVSSDEDEDDELPPASQIISGVTFGSGSSPYKRKRTISEASLLDSSPGPSETPASSSSSSPSKRGRTGKASADQDKPSLFLPSPDDEDDFFASPPSRITSGSSRASASSSSSQSKGGSTSGSGRFPLFLSSPDDDDDDVLAQTPKKPARRRPSDKNSTSRAEKEAAAQALKEQKAKEKQEKAEAKQRKKEEEAEAKRLAKEEVAAAKLKAKEEAAAAKAITARHRAANKLIDNPNQTLSELTIVLSTTFQRSHPDLEGRLHKTFRDYKGNVRCALTLLDGHRTIRWRKHITKEYRPHARTWVPCEPRDEFQKIALLWLKAPELLDIVKREALHTLVDDFRRAHGFNASKDQMFILIEGLRQQTPHFRAKAEHALAQLQITKHTFHIVVKDEKEGIERLFNMTRDIGMKPHKLIERSHLPFCGDTDGKSGQDEADTWVKMLATIHAMTESAADGVAQAFPTLRSLYEAYEAEDDERTREAILASCVISRRKDGTAQQRSLGPAMSQKVHTIFYGADHLALVKNAVR